MKLKVGSTTSLTTVRFETVALRDGRPVVHSGAAERIDSQADLRVADRLHVDHVAEVGDVVVEIVVR
jgi:hypothetical protein